MGHEFYEYALLTFSYIQQFHEIFSKIGFSFDKYKFIDFIILEIVGVLCTIRIHTHKEFEPNIFICCSFFGRAPLLMDLVVIHIIIIVILKLRMIVMTAEINNNRWLSSC